LFFNLCHAPEHRVLSSGAIQKFLSWRVCLIDIWILYR